MWCKLVSLWFVKSWFTYSWVKPKSKWINCINQLNCFNCINQLNQSILQLLPYWYWLAENRDPDNKNILSSLSWMHLSPILDLWIHLGPVPGLIPVMLQCIYLDNMSTWAENKIKHPNQGMCNWFMLRWTCQKVTAIHLIYFETKVFKVWIFCSVVWIKSSLSFVLSGFLKKIFPDWIGKT